MAPSPIPAPLPPWARFLIQLLPLIPTGLQEVLEHIGPMDGADAASPDAWMQVHMVGEPINSTEVADRFVSTIDFVNITNGQVDSSWTTDDTGAVAASVHLLMQDWSSRMSGDYRWLEQRFYKRYFNPLSVTEPFAPTGPPVIVYPAILSGTGTSFQAPQVAVTSTERTAYPGHWGRNYWPHPRASLVSTGGYIQSPEVDSWCTAVQSRYEALAAQEFFPVVPITQYTVGTQKFPARGLLGVTEIQVDNLFDVMRSRRPKKATYKKRLPI